MGAVSGIMSLFKSAPVVVPQNNAGTPGNLPNKEAPSNTVDGAAPNGVIPPGTGGDTTVKKEPAPFEAFSELWQPVKTDPNAPDPNAGVFGTIDPKKFMEAAGKIDFAKVVSPEQLAAIAGGGEAAGKAFMEAMNKVAQSAYAQSAFATTKIVEQAVAKSKETFLSELPQHIKRQTVTDSLRTENPIFANPAVAPIISALEAQMTVKYPNATAPEITAMAKQYVEQLGTAFTKKIEIEKDAKAGKGETDWSLFA